MSVRSFNQVIVEDEEYLYGWIITGYEDFTEIQYYEYNEIKERVNKGAVLSLGAGEVTEAIAKALIKVNVK